MVMASEEDVVQRIGYQLPLSYSYKKGEFFVRDCYPIYYEMITSRLKGTGLREPDDYITVTGTPGIGKSVFYIYFFQRWRKEHPDSSIVTASFNRERNLKRCLLFDKEHPSGLKCKKIPDIYKALHLYDGPPLVELRKTQ